jgi:glyoxylase-like metal-dependent hydrolase (beta-lactamase superfamily II)
MISWRVLNIGYISRNKYWGEETTRAYRSAVCTGVFINCGGIKIIVDPPLPPEQMDSLLDTRCGLKSGDIDIIFITHSHGDHFAGLGAFEHAERFLAPAEYTMLLSQGGSKELLEQVKPAERELAPGISVIDLPGHTQGLAGLEFRSDEGTVIVTGDAVMTREFFIGRSGYFNCVDEAASTQTIGLIASRADIVVPGHDNYFIVAAAGAHKGAL